MSYKLEAGLCMGFTGLKSAPQLNTTCGTLAKFHNEGPSAGRWSVRCDVDGEVIAVKPENLCVRAKADEPRRASTSLDKPSTSVLPPLTYKWNITDTSNISAEMLKTCHRVVAGAETIEQAEKEICFCVNQGKSLFEAMAFPPRYSQMEMGYSDNCASSICGSKCMFNIFCALAKTQSS
jgi:hypothetical protein